MALEFSLDWGEVPPDDFISNVAKELGWHTYKEALSEISTAFGFKEPVGFMIYSLNDGTDICINDSARSYCWHFTLRLNSLFEPPEEGIANMLRFAITCIGQLRSIAVLHFQYETVYFLVNENKELIISGTLWDNPEYSTLLDGVAYRREDLRIDSVR